MQPGCVRLSKEGFVLQHPPPSHRGGAHLIDNYGACTVSMAVVEKSSPNSHVHFDLGVIHCIIVYRYHILGYCAEKPGTRDGCCCVRHSHLSLQQRCSAITVIAFIPSADTVLGRFWHACRGRHIMHFRLHQGSSPSQGRFRSSIPL